jgi:VCBS repeat-containing protein
VERYFVKRFAGDTSAPPASVDDVGVVDFVLGQVPYSFVDLEELPDNQLFTYYIVAEFDDGALSNPSVFVTVTTINDEPTATDDDYVTGVGVALTVDATQGVIGNDEDVDSVTLTAEVVSGPSHGTLSLNADGSFTYTPNAGFADVDTFTYRANDVDLSRTPTAASEGTVTIDVQDLTPPVVTLTVPAATGGGGFFITSPVDVTLSATDPSGVAAFECLDNGVAIAPINQTGFGTADASGTVRVSREGMHDLVCTATDGVGNSGAATGSANTGIVNIDTVPPDITIAAPAEGAEYVLNASVAADYTCSDPDPGSGVASCSGDVTSGSSFDTSTVGPKTFTVTATDVAGNSTTLTSNYYVVYSITLAPLKRSAKLGSAVQVEYQLQDGTGNVISDLGTLVKMESVYNGPASGGCVPSDVGIRELLFSFPEGATGQSSFRFLDTSMSFRLNWDTATASTEPIITGEGCYTVLIYLDDKPTIPRMTTATQLR